MGRIPDRRHQAQLIHLTKRGRTRDSVDAAREAVNEVPLSMISQQTAALWPALIIAAGGFLTMDQIDSIDLLFQEHGGE